MPWRSLLAIALWGAVTASSRPPDFRAAARELDNTISRSYAYLDKLPGGVLPDSAVLRAEREAVADRDSLLLYAEHRIASLADHHAITGSSFSDSWAVIPTYADLWIVLDHDAYMIDAVREGSFAQAAGVRAGDRLVAIDGTEVALAVKAYWAELGLEVTPQRAANAARVLAAGRRDRNRVLTIASAVGVERQLTLPSLYRLSGTAAPITVTHAGRRTSIRFNNSLGDSQAIAAFDAAVAALPADRELVIDLRETPSGGNTVVARAIMGWFVDRPTGYQVHRRPEEERETGVARQWIEQVLPRPGMYRTHLPIVLVGRWTGSMGEGMAIGFAAMGADVRGAPMAGLLGSVEDIALGPTDLSVKLPTERLTTTSYQPREDYLPNYEQ